MDLSRAKEILNDPTIDSGAELIEAITVVREARRRTEAAKSVLPDERSLIKTSRDKSDPPEQSGVRSRLKKGILEALTGVITSIIGLVSMSPSRNQSYEQGTITQLLNQGANMLWFVCVFLAVAALLAWVATALFKHRLSPSAFPLVMCGLATPVLAYGYHIHRQTEEAASEARAELIDLVSDTRWIAYDPTHFDPHLGVLPDEASILNDLKTLKETGRFDGIITFGNSTDALPELNRQHGLEFKIIRGIWIPDDSTPSKDFNEFLEHEFAAVRKEASQNLVDAICVGHVRGQSTNIERLSKWIGELRRETGLPITHTAPIINYVGERGRALREIGDFYFPDVGGAFRAKANVRDALTETQQNCLLAAELPADKPVLLKMIGFPGDLSATTRYSPSDQQSYFQQFFLDTTFPRHVYPSFAFAFDRPFAGREAVLRPDQRDPSEEFMGLFTNEKIPRPKPALVELHRQWGLKPFSFSPSHSVGVYEVRQVQDAATENTEFRLFRGIEGESFQFATLLKNPAGGLIVRPRPSRIDPNGWGASIYCSPFLSGSGSDSSGTTALSVKAEHGIIIVSASGFLSSAVGRVGEWQLDMNISYQPNTCNVVGTASLQMKLDDPMTTLGGDLNAVRLSSNITTNVPLDGGGTGNSGDSRGAQWMIDMATGNRHVDGFDFPGWGHRYYPDGHYPEEAGKQVEIVLLGNVNRVAEDGPTSKTTPNIRLNLKSEHSNIRVGAQHDASTASRFEEDNFAVTPYIHRGDSKSTQVDIEYFFEAEAE